MNPRPVYFGLAARKPKPVKLAIPLRPDMLDSDHMEIFKQGRQKLRPVAVAPRCMKLGLPRFWAAPVQHLVPTANDAGGKG